MIHAVTARETMSPTLRFFAVLPILMAGVPFALHILGVAIPSWLVLFCLLIALMLTGTPISIALGLTVLTFVLTMTKVPIESIALKLFTGIERFEIMAVPFFILAGKFLTYGGVARKMINFAMTLVGHLHGGLALAGILACALFALVCGSSVATVVAIGSIVLPEMVQRGYPMRFGAGVITVAGSLGILMLPSIPKVIYAIATNTSIGALFVAGLLPGILITFMLCTVTWYIARKNDYPRLPKASLGEVRRTIHRSQLAIQESNMLLNGIVSDPSPDRPTAGNHEIRPEQLPATRRAFAERRTISPSLQHRSARKNSARPR